MRSARTLAPYLFAATTALLLSCAQEDESGTCKGTMDGSYFRLQLYSADTEDATEIRVNGRFIGSVPRGATQPDQTIRWGEKQLGIFPVCDKMEIESSGASGVSGRFCSNASYFTAECRRSKQDFCWETFGFYPPRPEGPPPVYPDERLQSPQCGLAVLKDTTGQVDAACRDVNGLPLDCANPATPLACCPCLLAWEVKQPGEKCNF